MKRKYFLLGMLCGCLLGVAATIVWRQTAGRFSPHSAPLTPTFIFTGRPADQSRPPGVPPDAERREINGQPPLAMREKG